MHPACEEGRKPTEISNNVRCEWNHRSDSLITTKVVPIHLLISGTEKTFDLVMSSSL
jgi:hypothetical protein